MTDNAIDFIKNADGDEVNFQWFRSSLRGDNGLKNSLNYGHAIIDTAPKLDQYLHTYGPMIESQWESISGHLDSIDQPTLYIDYGCGQGLAGLLINDLTEGRLLSKVRDIVLIEPSGLALARATELYRRIAPSANIISICKAFNDVKKSDIPPVGSGTALHIFSNSLDILGFKPTKLLENTLHTGHHTILSVSHDRDFNGGTPQIEAVKAAFENPAMASQLTIQRSTLDRFTCDNPSQSKGVVWLCEVEV